MTAPETAPAERDMGEGLAACPACGALPCDWTENPFASDDVPADAGDKCANCKGLIGDLAEGRDPEELCDTCYRDALAATPTALPSAEDALREAVKAKPLFWRKGTDHPQDGEAAWIADGISGRYSASKQRDGTWLLWWAHDNFIWEACATFDEVKSKAEADWQTRFAERIAK